MSAFAMENRVFSNYVLSVFSVLYFLYAFFPTATNNNSYSVVEPPENLYDIRFNKSQVYAQVVDRLIMIVIDALRHDFVTASNMPFTTETTDSNGCQALVKVEAPTVTLPRIKALTTGSVPQFSDVLFNLMSTESLTDSFIQQAVGKGKRIVFYGDDTWLKIHPKAFVRSEGTSSFYVNDFTEVDDNVTRNVNKELHNADWDIMILHYLGLDHIGHVSGPFSPLIRPKLQEMDDVIRNIYESTLHSNRKTLVLITGDHGMKDSGGHGGTTYSETRVPLVLLGKPCRNDSISQVDIPPMLSVLLGLTLPAENIGKISVNILGDFYDAERLLYVLRYNVLALQKKAGNLCSAIDNISVVHYNFLKNDSTLYEQAKQSYVSCASEISEHLLHNSIEQNEFVLIVSCMAIVFCFILNALAVFNTNKNKQTQNLGLLIVPVVLSLNYFNTFYFVSYIVLAFALVILADCLLQVAKLISATRPTPLILGCVLHSMSLTSTSFVEEEHQTWYFFMGTFLLFQAGSTVKKSPGSCLRYISLLVGLRFLRKLNQTGDKWAFLPDLGDWFLLDENVVYLRAFYLCSMGLVCVCCRKYLGARSLFVYLILFSICALKILDARDCKFAQIVWGFILVNFVVNVNSLARNITVSLVLVSCLLLRPHNVILLAYCVYASSVFFKQIKNAGVLIIAHTWLGNVLFFCQGHSNSFASVDIASGYIGLENYKPIIVTLLVLFHTYSLPILSHVLLMQSPAASIIWKHILSQRLLILTVVVLNVYLQRHHLFVWTVFAPKLLIESSHSLVLLVMLTLYSIKKLVHHFLGQ